MQSLKCVRDRVTASLDKFNKQDLGELYHLEEKYLGFSLERGANTYSSLKQKHIISSRFDVLFFCL